MAPPPRRQRTRSLDRARLAGLVSAAAGLGCTLHARDGLAYDALVDASFAAQVYQVGSPYGDPVLGRRRYTQTLSLRMFDLQGEHRPGGPELSATARLRLDSDFGQAPEERSPSRPDAFVPGLAEQPLDVMMAYVEGRNYGGGLLGFRLGRQYVVDPLGWWSFDGAMVRLSTSAHIAAEAYGGFEQRGGPYLLGTSRYEADGVLRGNRHGMGDGLWPAYLNESSLAPAYGFSLSSAGLAWLDAKLSYRKVVQRDTVNISPFPDAAGRFETTRGDRVSSERVGFSGVATADGVGALRGGFVYDAVSARTSEYAASVDWFPAAHVQVGAGADYFLPTFDGDSIFNWFSHLGTTTLRGRAAWDATRRISVSGNAGARRFDTEGEGALLDFLASVDGAYRTPIETVTVRVVDEHGQRGSRRGGDASYRRTYVGGLLDSLAIASLYGFRDGLRPDRSTTSVTYVLGGGYHPFPRTRVGVEWEHTINDLVGQRFRALCTLDLTVF